MCNPLGLLTRDRTSEAAVYSLSVKGILHALQKHPPVHLAMCQPLWPLYDWHDTLWIECLSVLNWQKKQVHIRHHLSSDDSSLQLIYTHCRLPYNFVTCKQSYGSTPQYLPSTCNLFYHLGSSDSVDSLDLKCSHTYCRLPYNFVACTQSYGSTPHYLPSTCNLFDDLGNSDLSQGCFSSSWRHFHHYP